MSARLYKYIINVVDKRIPTFARPFWEYEAGPKTMSVESSLFKLSHLCLMVTYWFRFFWAPLCKWGLVIAGIKDLTRPAELLSAEQALAIGSTGFIYSRFSMVIIPKNYTLLSVNVFVAITQSIQLYRVLRYKYENKNKAIAVEWRRDICVWKRHLLR